MTLILNGTDNSATTPAVTGTDTDTGVYYPAANQVALATNGTQALIADASQNVGLSKSAPVARLHLAGSGTSGQVTSSFIIENTSSGTMGIDITGSAGSSVARFRYGGGPGTGTNAMTGSFMTAGLEGVSAGTQGIQFAATQVSSANANTLDDYEEGTFTPTIDGSSSSPTVTYTNQTGYYTRVGQIVTCNFYLEGTARTGGTGTLTIRGCPFPVIQAKAMGGNALTYAISSGGTASLYPTFTSDGSAAFYLLASANGGGTWTQIGVTSVTNGLWAIHACVTYQTNT